MVDLTHIAPNTRDFITAGDAALNVAKAYLATSPPVIPSEDIELRAPITKMDKVEMLVKSEMFNVVLAGSLYWYELQGPL